VGRAFFIDKDFHCPKCGHKLDAASHSDGKDHAPEKGDVSLCFKCAAIMVFDDRFTIRKATPEEEEAIMRDEAVRQVYDAILWANEEP